MTTYKRILIAALLFFTLALTALRTAPPVSADCLSGCRDRGISNQQCTALCGGVNGNAEPIPFNPLDGPDNETFDALNPLQVEQSPVADQLSTPGGIISRILEFAFPAAGLILFLMLVWGGFEILIGGANKKSLDAGKQRITAAVVGFVLLFSSYWIMQIIEIIFGIVIL